MIIQTKKDKLYASIAILFFACQFSSAQQVVPLNIDTCYAMARRNYPMVKQFALIEKSKEYTISNANKGYLPQVSLTAIGGYIAGLPNLSAPGSEPSGNQNLKFIGIGQISQALWDGGASRTQKNIAKASAEVDNANVETALYSIRERIDQIYFGILLIDQQTKQLVILQENLNRNLGNVKLSKDNGLAYQSDVDEVKAEVLSVEQRQIEFTFTRKGYAEMLGHLIGSALPENVTLQQPLIAESLTTLENNRPELKTYANQQRVVEMQSSLNKVYNMPKVGLLGYGVMIQPGASFGASTLSSIFVGGVSLSWNTSNLYKTANNKQLDKIQMEKIHNQKETFLFTNQLQSKQTSSEIEKQKAIATKDDEIVALKNKIKNAYQLKYDNGMCSMNDVITSVYKESEARSNQALHDVQLLLTQYNFKTITGN